MNSDGVVTVCNPKAAGQDHERCCCERLEDGGILLFERAPFALDAEQQRVLLGVQGVAGLYKNVSYSLEKDQVAGVGQAAAQTLRSALHAWAVAATRFAAATLPRYARRWRVDLTSFRPIEERDRRLPVRSRNDLLHLDAFPSRPSNGDRILRLFTNINPQHPRVWLTTERFADLARRHALDAGLKRIAATGRRNGFRRLPLAIARSLGLSVPDRSPYDRFMLHFHDYLKTSKSFQHDCPKQKIEFPPGCTWIAFTDMVAHAVLAGQFALEQTFIVPCDAMVAPEKAPVRVLERICGNSLQR